MAAWLEEFRRHGTRKSFQLAEIQTGDMMIEYLVR